MIAALSKVVFTALARSPHLKRLASRHGMRNTGGFVRRFVAGETPAEAIATARAIEASGCQTTLDLLGEHVTSTEAAAEATSAYVELAEEVEAAGIGRNLSIKLTQLGLDVDRATAIDNLRRVLGGTENGFFIRVDMEHSRYVDATLDIVEAMWHMGHRSLGVVLQAALHRTEQDLRRINALGMRVRLVKGAYRESQRVAFQDPADVRAAFLRLMPVLLRDGTAPAVATHDEALIDAVRALAARERIGKDRFEFQMLYGVRRDLQAALRQDGYRFRVYIPFGRDWFPYVMRRLGERPANVRFVLRALLRDTATAAPGTPSTRA